ncbi:MAG TPA: c-type cytochrome [Puia sp.]|nr:c-type cytochrome [Puia sp.]
MAHAKKISAAMILASFFILGIAATRPPEEPHHKNLKVLPKNISHDDLDKVMDGFKAALGVKCNFCHAAFKDSAEHKLDFASDEKPEKNIARHMMRMTAKINKKFFSFNKDEQGNSVQTVSCITCHRGNPHPVEK